MIDRKTFFKNFFDVLSTIIMFLSIFVLLFSIYTAYNYKNNPEEAYLFGYKPVLVLTGSMEPTLKTNSVAIVKKINYNEVKKDDILMYKIEDKVITHRVIEKNKNEIITKGDNNQSKDAYLIKKENVKGIVVYKLNFLSVPISEIIPDGIKGEINKFAIVKWIVFPIFAISMLCIIKNAIIKLIKEGKKEKDNNFKNAFEKGELPDGEQ